MNLKEALMRAYVAGWECVDDTDEDKIPLANELAAQVDGLPPGDRVIVVVRGGVVQGAHSSHPKTTVDVLDYDEAEANEEAAEVCAGLEHDTDVMHPVL